MDVGAGDGHASLRAARNDPTTLAVALDPSIDRLRDGARTALREKLPNAVFAVASIEQLPCELDGRADAVTITLPWGSLLRGIVQADTAVLGPLARLTKVRATVRVLVSIEPNDRATGLRPLDLATLRGNAHKYEQAGFLLEHCADATFDEVDGSGSSWARRIAKGADRRIFAMTLRRV